MILFLIILCIQVTCASQHNALWSNDRDVTESPCLISNQCARILLRDEIKEFSIADKHLQRDFFTQSLLLRAIQLGDEASVKSVLKKGLNINDTIENERLSILNKAIICYDSRSVKIILRNGGRLKTNDGKHPLLVALENEIQSDSPFTLKIKLLLSAGANPDSLSTDGKSIEQVLAMQQSLIEKKPPIAYMSKNDFIKKVALLLDEARERKRILREKVIQILTHPQFIDTGNNFIPLPVELAKYIAELAYHYRD